MVHLFYSQDTIIEASMVVRYRQTELVIIRNMHSNILQILLFFPYMNFCEIAVLLPCITIRKLRLRLAKKFGWAIEFISWETTMFFHVSCSCSFYCASQFTQLLTSSHLNSPQTMILGYASKVQF